MDASLHTLELMASEVGATVIVLKEIVLAAPTYPQRGSTRNESPAGWIIPSVPPWQSASQQSEKKKAKKKKAWSRARRRDIARQGQESLSSDRGPNVEKQIVFDLPDHDEEEGTESEDEVLDNRDDRPDACRQRGASVASVATSASVESTDDDVPTFHLELGDTNTHEVEKVPSFENNQPKITASKPMSAKARKALLRREARRLDLLRGDGTSALNPHAPSRPSSLRLASPIQASSANLPINEEDNDGENPDGAFLQNLLVTPLDSLSLSFADVQTVPPVPPESPPNELPARDAFDHPDASDTRDLHDTLPPGDEKICVEALVVRKVVHEEGDGWWGGQDDGWGLTPEDEEVDEDDGWQF